MTTDDDKREEGDGASDPQGIPDDGAISWVIAVIGGICLFFGLLRSIPTFWFPERAALWSWVLLGVAVLCAFGSATIRRLFRKQRLTTFAVLLIFIGIIFLLLAQDPVFEGTDRGVAAIIGGLSLIIGLGYLLFKLFLLGVRKTSEAAKVGAARVPPAGKESFPPEGLKTRLQDIEDLHNEGLLTDAEYQAKREEILGEV